MSEEMPRSIRFPKKLWEAIDAEAQRCRRSSVKQLEAILTAYYGLEDVEVDRERLVMLGQIAARSSAKTKIIAAEDVRKKKTA